MDPQREIPEYRLKRDSFFEPNLLPKGSTIRWEGGVGDHLEPLNEAAYLKLEEWFGLEVPELDRHGKETGRTVKIREKYRPVAYTAPETHSVEVVAMPEPPKESAKSLAEVMNATPKATSQRPPGEVLDQRPVWRPKVEEVTAAAAADDAPAPVQPEVISAAPATSVARRVG